MTSDKEGRRALADYIDDFYKNPNRRGGEFWPFKVGQRITFLDGYTPRSRRRAGTIERIVALRRGEVRGAWIKADDTGMAIRVPCKFVDEMEPLQQLAEIPGEGGSPC